MLLDLLAHAAEIDAVGNGLLHGGFRGGVCEVRLNCRLLIGGVFGVVALDLLLEPRGVRLHDIHDALGKNVDFDIGLGAIEVELDVAEVQIQLAHINLARVDLNTRSVKGRHA